MRRAAAIYLLILVAAAAIFLLFPGLDLWASGLFYRPSERFFLADDWPFRLVYRAVPYLVDIVVVGVPAVFLLSLWRGRPVCGIDRRAATFLLLALALGPGLLVNTVLKDHWGRARPSQTVAFGGTQQFTPAPLPARQCAHNCSFPAGHPAIGFYLVSFAFLLRDRRRRRQAEAAAIAAGVLIGIVRMAQGGHFLSDVVFSGLLVYATSWLLYHLVVVQDVLRGLAAPIRAPPWFAAGALAGGALLLASMVFIDRPIARLFHDGNATVHATFAFITQFGLGDGYLVASAAAYLTLRLSAWRWRDRPWAERLMLNANRALFIFCAVAASGLLVDLLKVVFGRARPKLLFVDGTYGFFWGAWQADYWSFPSGHATTIAALAAAFFLLWPRFLPAYLAAALLVTASRIIIDAHYVSDALAGALLGVVVTWLLHAAFVRAAVPLAPKAPTAELPGARSLRDTP
jgi:lipid A 4'-phosphatase